jgi:hypothetical protein
MRFELTVGNVASYRRVRVLYSIIAIEGRNTLS